MQTRPLAENFAIEIRGIDIGVDLGDETFDEIRRLWLRHGVAVFPDQHLDDDSLVRFAKRFGRLFVHAQSSLLSSRRKEVMELSNLPGAERKTAHELDWHTDQSYTPRPVFGTMLYGVVAPAEGGETHFADLAGAYATLPEPLRGQIDGVRGLFSAEPRPSVRETPLTAEERARIPDCEHPIARTHPYLGTTVLYISPLHMARVGALSERESLDLISRLTAHATRTEHVYRHRWRNGDLVLWDNARIIHRRTPFPSHVSRHLKRTGFYFPDDVAIPY